MSAQLKKPVCAIVGAGPGNGAAFARKLTGNGYRVALLARGTESTKTLSEQLEGARAYACDGTVAESIERAFAAIREEMGDVDALIYNAGSGVWKNVEDITAEEFEQSWRVNALGAFLASRQVIPAMKNNGRGSIVFIGATASRRGNVYTAAFAPAKAAQKSLAESMARHLGPHGVHVAILIIDGVVDTPETRKKMPDKADEFFVQPGAVADALLHLLDQKPSAWAAEMEGRPFGEKW